MKKIFSRILAVVMIMNLGVSSFASPVDYNTQAKIAVDRINAMYETDIVIDIYGHSVDARQYDETIEFLEEFAEDQYRIKTELENIKTYTIGELSYRANPELDMAYEKSQLWEKEITDSLRSVLIKQTLKAILDSDRRWKSVTSIKTISGNNSTTWTSASQPRYAYLDQGITLKTYQTSSVKFDDRQGITWSSKSVTVEFYWPF